MLGDALLDRDVNGTASRLCPDAPAPVLDDLTEIRRPGGAALAALLAARDGGRVVLVAPIGDDPASAIVRALLEPHVTVVPVPLDGPLPDKARFRAGGRPCCARTGPPAGRALLPWRRPRRSRRRARSWSPTTAAARPPTRGSAPPWPGVRPACRWSGIRIRAGRSRCLAPGWPPPTTPKPGRPRA